MATAQVNLRLLETRGTLGYAPDMACDYVDHESTINAKKFMYGVDISIDS